MITIERMPMPQFAQTDVNTSCLLIIDVQKAFITTDTFHIQSRIEAAQSEYTHIIISKFYNLPDSPYRKVLHYTECSGGSRESELAFIPRFDATIYEKNKYSALTLTLRQFLFEHGFKNIDICGISTEACVMSTAIDLFESGYTPCVRSTLCASTVGENIHLSALDILRHTIGKENVIL